MRENNTIDGIEFVLNHIFWGWLAWVWYNTLLFRCAPQCSLAQSRRMLLTLVIGCSVMGIILQIEKKCNKTSVFLDLAFGYGVYTVLAHWHFYGTLIRVSLGTAFVLSAFCAGLILCRKIKNKEHIRQILRIRLESVFCASEKLIGIGFLFIMVVVGVNVLLNTKFLKADVLPANKTNLNEQTITNNIDTVLLLQEDEWEKLSSKERLNVLQTIANIEQRYLGIPHEMNVRVGKLEDGTLGNYNDTTHEITISMDSLQENSSWDLLETLCHEVYHCYQHCLVEVLQNADESSKNLRIFQSARTYAEEFENYIDGNEEFESYYSQECEEDAREYGEDSVYDYYFRIQNYLEEKNGE